MKINLESYEKHSAFNRSVEIIKTGNINSISSWNIPQKFHHNTKELELFKSYVDYKVWFNELIYSSENIIDNLRLVHQVAIKNNSAWYSNKRNINKTLDILNSMENSINNLHYDIMEYEKCILATDINGNYGNAQILASSLSNIDSFSTRISITCNRKLSDINSSRVTLIGLIISIFAIAISMISLLYD